MIKFLKVWIVFPSQLSNLKEKLDVLLFFFFKHISELILLESCVFLWRSQLGKHLLYLFLTNPLQGVAAVYSLVCLWLMSCAYTWILIWMQNMIRRDTLYYTSYRQECVHAPNINTLHIHGGSCRSWFLPEPFSPAHMREYHGATHNMHQEHTITSAWWGIWCAPFVLLAGSKCRSQCRFPKSHSTTRIHYETMFIYRQGLVFETAHLCRRPEFLMRLDNERANHEYATQRLFI